MTDLPGRGTRRHFTDNARAALAETRRRAKENPILRATIGVFVTRVSDGRSFGWEIRRFGGVVLERGETTFGTPAEAKAEGERALAVRLSAATVTPDVPLP